MQYQKVPVNLLLKQLGWTQMNMILHKAALTATITSLATSAVADMAEVNGANLYYEQIGSGPAILMMHGGLGLSHDYLRPYFDALSDTYTIVYYDHFGNGRSDKPDDYADMDFARLISDADALMTTLGHDTFTLIGHSYGGFIAQEFALSHQDRLDGMILVGTAPVLDYSPSIGGSVEQMMAFARLLSEPMADDADFQATWFPVFQSYFHEWDDEVGADLDARTVYEHRAWNVATSLLGTFNVLDKLPSVTIPTLVTSGRHDTVTPPELGATRFNAAIPGSHIFIFENSGHYPFIEEEEMFFAVLREWLVL